MMKQWWVGAFVAIGVMVFLTGCSSIQGTMRSLGLESRSSWMARQLQEQNRQLASEKSELEARLAAQMMEERNRAEQLAGLRTQLEQQQAVLNELKDALTARATEGPERRELADERWVDVADQLRGLGTPIVTDDGRPGIRLAGDILFDPGEVDIEAGAKNLLNRVAREVRSLDSDIVTIVDGHTDSDPLNRVKHLYGDNYGLGMARANSVARLLVSQGVPQNKIITRSFGPDVPVADNETDEGKRRNRRVDITFAFTDSPGISRGSDK